MKKVALFLHGALRFALPVEGILQIRPLERVFPLPLLRAGVRGVFLERDEIVPLLDIGRLVAASSGESAVASAEFLVVFGTELGSVGIPADKVLQIVDRGDGKLQEVDSEQRRCGIEAHFVFKGEGYPLLFVDALLASLPS